MKKKKIIIISICAAVVLLIGTAMLVSYAKFNTVNFLAAGKGIITISTMGEDTVIVNNHPRVIIAKPDNDLLDEYMTSHGYEEVEDEQLGAIRVYSNGREKHHILYSVNKYYSVWKWQ